MKTIRVFISSPGDVAEERKRAREVLDQLQRWYGSDRVLLQPVLWEDLPLQADASFQEGIDTLLSASLGVDVAVFILWSRLGSPPGMRRPDGTAYRSGTEREFELMLAARKASGGVRPALLAYVRRDDDAWHQQLRGKSSDELKERLAQFDGVKSFIEESFQDERGHNLRAYHSFDVPITFAGRLKVHLLSVLDELLAGSLPAAATWTRSPYRGLEVFDFDDAPIFFGRDTETCELQELLRRRERLEGLAFACIVGASGSGKSSLARAGVAANLTRFNLDPETGHWRAALLLPRQAEGRLVEAVARCLWKAVPELERRGSVADFELAMARDPELAVRLSLRPALEAANARVVLVVDQLEELFTLSVTAEARTSFWKALEALARGGRVWVLATLRSDFYAVAQREPGFLRLKGHDGHFDLLPPSGEGLAALISQPAALAGLRFERQGQASLQTRIFEEALAQRDALPLLEYLLAELYQRRSPESVLTTEQYVALGGVAGAIGQRAEAVFESLSVETRASLDGVLRQLVTAQEDGAVAARAAPREAFAPGTPQDALVTAFTRERLLLSDGDAELSRVRVAHEALLSGWERARAIIHADRERLLARGRLETAFKRWEASGRAPDLLLPSGLPLVEAESLARAWRGALSPALHDYLARSRKTVRRRQQAIAGVVAAVVLALAGLATVAFRSASLAEAKAHEAREQLAQAQIEQSNYLACQGAALEPELGVVAATLVALEGVPKADERALTDDAAEALTRLGPRLPEFTLQLDASDRVCASEFSPDGKQLLVTAAGRVTVIDAETGKSQSERLLQRWACTPAHFSSDGAHVVAFEGKTLLVWQAKTGATVWKEKLEGFSDPNFQRTFVSPGGELIVAQNVNDVIVFEAATGTKRFSIKADLLTGVSFDRAGHVLTSSSDGAAKRWHKTTGAELGAFKHPGAVLAVIPFSGAQGEERIATLDPPVAAALPGLVSAGLALVDPAESKRGPFKLFTWGLDSKSGGELFKSDERLRLHGTLELPSSQLLISSPQQVVLIDSATGEVLHRVPVEEGVTEALVVPASKLIAVAAGRRVLVWQPETDAVVGTLWHGSRVAALAVSGSEGACRIATVTNGGEVSSWASPCGAVRSLFEPSDWGLQRVSSESLHASVFASDDGLITLSREGLVSQRDPLTHEAAREWWPLGNEKLTSGALSADGRRVMLTWSKQAKCSAWEVADGGVLLELSDVKHSVFNAQGTEVAVQSRQGTIERWSLERGANAKPLSSFEGAGELVALSGGNVLAVQGDLLSLGADAGTVAVPGGVASGRVSADQRLFAGLSPDGRVSLVDLGERPRVLWQLPTGHRSAEFVPGEAQVVTTAEDGKVELWDARTGERRQWFRSRDGAIQAMVSPDGATILTLSSSGSLSTWIRRSTLSRADYVQSLKAKARARGWCLSDSQRQRLGLQPTPGCTE